MSDPRVIVAFLTGQSDPTNDALSPSQRGFLERSSVPALERMPVNFPYRPSAAEWRSIPLWRASIHNACQYWRSRHPAFATRYRHHIISTFEDYDRVIILAGSCGLELLANLHLPQELMQRVHVFAYGPVSRILPECATLRRVRGENDHLSNGGTHP